MDLLTLPAWQQFMERESRSLLLSEGDPADEHTEQDRPMQRPLMEPEFFNDGPPRRRPVVWPAVCRLARAVGRTLILDVGLRRNRPLIEDASPLLRALRGVFYRLLFTPLLLALVICAMIYHGTHPLPQAVLCDPQTQGTYYEPVSVLSDDGVRLESWLVPMIDARMILLEKEDALRRKQSAVILLHDFGHNAQQLLALIKPLHDAGFVVLAPNLRGAGGSTVRGCTFGLDEAQDVKACVQMLRRRPFVDPDRIALVGIGSGASAALLAADDDARIAAVVADRPIQDGHAAVAAYLAPRQSWLKSLTPAYVWAFEIAYNVDADALAGAVERNTSTLRFDESSGSCLWAGNKQRLMDYLKSRLQGQTASTN